MKHKINIVLIWISNNIFSQKIVNLWPVTITYSIVVVNNIVVNNCYKTLIYHSIEH